MKAFKALALTALLLLGTVALAAPPPSRSLQLLSPEVLTTQHLNLTKIFDEKSLDSSRLSTDHFDFQILGTPITIQFYNITHTLPLALTRACLRQALDACTAHRIAGEAHKFLEPRPYSYSTGTFPDGVHLILIPQADQLTWTFWAQVIIALFTVQEYLEYQELRFTIMWELWPGRIRVDGNGKMWGDPGTVGMEGLDAASA